LAREEDGSFDVEVTELELAGSLRGNVGLGGEAGSRV